MLGPTIGNAIGNGSGPYIVRSSGLHGRLVSEASKAWLGNVGGFGDSGYGRRECG